LFIFHGDQDKKVFLDQSQRIQAVYTKAKLPVTLKVLPGSGHGDKEFYAGKQRELMVEFLDRHLGASHR